MENARLTEEALSRLEVGAEEGIQSSSEPSSLAMPFAMNDLSLSCHFRRRFHECDGPSDHDECPPMNFAVGTGPQIMPGGANSGESYRADLLPVACSPTPVSIERGRVHDLQELLVDGAVVVRVVMLGRQNHACRAGCEVAQLVPDHGGNIEARRCA